MKGKCVERRHHINQSKKYLFSHTCIQKSVTVSYQVVICRQSTSISFAMHTLFLSRDNVCLGINVLNILPWYCICVVIVYDKIGFLILSSSTCSIGNNNVNIAYRFRQNVISKDFRTSTSTFGLNGGIIIQLISYVDPRFFMSKCFRKSLRLPEVAIFSYPNFNLCRFPV